MLEKIQQDLRERGQEHLMEGLSSLKDSDIQNFSHQLKTCTKLLLEQQRKCIQNRKPFTLSNGTCPSTIAVDEAMKAKGLRAIELGKMACLILAGGQGTRLGFSGPKGMFPVTPVRHKSLLQVHLEKVKALSETLKCSLEVAIMVSSLNQEEIIRYLQKNSYFGLPAACVHLVCQQNLPFLSEQGNWFLDRPGHINQGPDGNGKAFLVLSKASVLDRWEKNGIKYINIVQIDNPLSDPFDAEIAALHEIHGKEIVIKCIERRDEKESVGVLVEYKEGLSIVEYSDLSIEERSLKDQSGRLKLPFANTGLMSFSMEFVQRHLQQMEKMPWHLAYKEAFHWSLSEGSFVKKGWKFECFIFDLMTLSHKIGLVLAKRELCYSPLKNAKGEKSLYDVQTDLLLAYRRLYTHVSGLEAPKREFELDSAFWYPSKELKESWKGRALPEKKYIEP